jgi:SAM-dependent methyltransferase
LNLFGKFRARSRSALRSAYYRATNPDYKSVWNDAAIDNAKRWIFTGATDETFEATGRQDAERLLPLIGRESKVLNIGCGIGRVEKYLAPHVAEMWGVDISGEMIARATRRLVDLPNVHLRELAAGEYLSSFDTGSFDLVFSVLVLQHMEKEDAFRYLEDTHRVLKSGGRLFVQFPNFLSPEYTAALIESAHESPLNPGRVRTYTLEETRHLLGVLNFGITKLELASGRDGNAEIYATSIKP